MDGRLACQTEVTPDARDLYRRADDDCDGCRIDWQLRGAAQALIAEDDELDNGGTVISLARAVLALGLRGEARSIAPARSDADWDLDFGGH
jgi:hypothetical protein